MIKKKGAAIAVGSALLLIVVLVLFLFLHKKKILSGYPPDENVSWAPSSFVLLPQSDPPLSLFIRFDSETDANQIFLYKGLLENNFQEENVLKLTSSEGDKQNPTWGPILSERGPCQGQSLLYLADDLAEREETQKLFVLCLEGDLNSSEITITPETLLIKNTEGVSPSLTGFTIGFPNDFERARVTVATTTGEILSSALTEPSFEAMIGERLFTDYENLTTYPNTSLIIFKAYNRNQPILGILNPEDGTEQIMASLEEPSFSGIQFSEGLHPTIFFITEKESESLLHIIPAEATNSGISWCREEGILPLSGFAKNSQPLAWRGANLRGNFLEIFYERWREENQHHIQYGRIPLTECSLGTEEINRNTTLAFEKQTELTCGSGDHRNPRLIFQEKESNQTEATPLLTVFKLKIEEKKFELEVLNLKDRLNNLCECSMDIDCDDGNPCTTDFCQAGTCNYAKDDPNCCNTTEDCAGENCVNHVCTAPEIKVAEREASSTVVPNQESNSKSNSPEPEPKPTNCQPPQNCSCQNDADCTDDENLCNGVMYCDKSGQESQWHCVVNPKTIVTCPKSKESCQSDICNPATGACEIKNIADGTSCPSGHPCYKESACQNGACTKGLWDYLDPQCQCSNDQDCKKYEDGNACNGTLYCLLATHQCLLNPATTINCPSAFDTVCQQNLCQPKTGKCEMTPLQEGIPCDDNNFCTEKDMCHAGKCTPGKNICECNKDADCTSKAKDLCEGFYYCDVKSHACLLNPASKVVCSTVDDTECAKNSCDPSTGKCSLKPLSDGQACNADGLYCTPEDQCLGGKCTASKWDFKNPFCQCFKDSDCVDDGNLCNGIPYCNKIPPKNPAELITYQCLNNPKTVITCPATNKTTCNPATGKCDMKIEN
ncbi:MAG: hypothetical protein A3G32_05385 [Deltaproteobacteria bacterium RIFCSPLOWO2_12_FULL_40_28]|nr:MAG: hypothetical protein A3C45_09495 [Deltaproteobacteria bacterium RIFCSPHIGHO2_02_FULL_40_28]OGQ19790.1 MAG: hypothetical protein A3E27_08690 [Deltaproteobacteria bacterium RIFCSPHIGHO2_12_FULL_40_32]OGQ41067.1 MAG: hypothetical protein A3I69_04105 [Deltaproteobacteria bacterium RIFCSPLOWO2_02_FULL_40_36]OGQ54183.1 MAG: hypothetical protein A3G32_05385 [Deltaproteobacteria bacterium RIFCSPLOWO2_12_FULL_40_28]